MVWNDHCIFIYTVLNFANADGSSDDCQIVNLWNWSISNFITNPAKIKSQMNLRNVWGLLCVLHWMWIFRDNITLRLSIYQIHVHRFNMFLAIICFSPVNISFDHFCFFSFSYFSFIFFSCSYFSFLSFFLSFFFFSECTVLQICAWPKCSLQNPGYKSNFSMLFSSTFYSYENLPSNLIHVRLWRKDPISWKWLIFTC